MRALVTGATGFVGGHLCRFLRANGHDVFAFGGPAHSHTAVLDVLHEQRVFAAIRSSHPDVVFHLAAQTFVPDTVASPLETYKVNILGTAHVARAIARHVEDSGVRSRLVFASSAEVYGRVSSDLFPLRESTPTSPRNPYAASKAAAESILKAEHHTFGLDIVICRPFNHIGPGQQGHFAIPNFAMQLAKIELGAPKQVSVGNLDARRDFLDVRDVVAAYALLAEFGVSGETYNICSGVPRGMKSVLDTLIQIAGHDIDIVEDPSRMRPASTPESVGDNAKLRSATGWEPQLSIDASLRDVYAAALETARGALP